ncbi:golgin subfamily A member 3 isoform X2 [Gadus macrocephalus]|uniref:golgin subfamily A member 3 isoform X2 n=1 Tax=Gadus macrocephalus TaxID=80720 RepID=UPI0028CB6689|nr:golgin subfamily A member 3 isoform X2 [Gadus macrocephalus]
MENLNSPTLSLPRQTSYRTYSVCSDSSSRNLPSTSSMSTTLSSGPYNLNGSYESVRYLVPVQQQQMQQQQQQFMVMPQAMPQMQVMPQMMTSQVMPQMMATQVMPQMMTAQVMPQMMTSQVMPQMMQQVYMQQNVPRISISSQESSEMGYQQHSMRESMNGSISSMISMSSPVKSPEPYVFEEEVELLDDVEARVEVAEEEFEEVEEVVEEEVVEEEVELEETEIINVIQPRLVERIVERYVERPVERYVERPVEQVSVRSSMSEHRSERNDHVDRSDWSNRSDRSDRSDRSLRSERIDRSERSERSDYPQVMKMDTRFFGELLAEVYRKNCDIHSCISEHVAKIRGRKHQLDSTSDYKMEREEVEALIPKGASELTKQQIRYLLQTRLTADKSMRLLLSTFSSLREELLHMSDDLRRLESDKESLEKDLSFKADQAQQYDRLLEVVRENNRQLQTSLQESQGSQRSMESQMLSAKTEDSGRDFKLKEVEGRLRALEQENDMLRQKLAGQGSSNSASLQVKTEELSRQYQEQLSALKMEKENEMKSLQTQLTRIRTETTTTSSSSDRSHQLKITELTTMLEQRQRTITHLEQEIKKLRFEMSESSKNVTRTVITKKYRNHYPILGLLGDDYNNTSPIKEGKTIVIERTGDIIKQVNINRGRERINTGYKNT